MFQFLAAVIPHVKLHRIVLSVAVRLNHSSQLIGPLLDCDQSTVDSHNLTARQLEILRLIVRGKSTREIASGLGLSIKTVETHRSQIMKRLQIYEVAGLVLFAVRERIISLDD